MSIEHARKGLPHMRDLTTCLQCGYCSAYCPVANVKGWESYAPRGKVYWLRRFMNYGFFDRMLGNKAVPNKEIMQRVYSCTLCGRCEAVCHVNIKFSHLWEEVRQWFVENEYGPPIAQKDMVKKIFDDKTRNPFSEPLEKRDEWYRDSLEEKQTADVVYFPGCQTSYYEYKLLLNLIKVLNKAGVDFAIMGTKESCCGAINNMSGQLKDFSKIADHNTNMIRKTGATTMLTNCPGCYRSFRSYRKYVGDLGFEVKHSTEIIWDLIRDGTITPKKEIKAKNLPIAYHDPCELGRLGGIYDPPRNILRSIPGIDEVVEFHENRKLSACCGGGGGLKAVDFDLSTSITIKKIEDLYERGVKSVATACPTCKGQLSTGASSLDERIKTEGGKPPKIKAFDVIDLLAKSL